MQITLGIYNVDTGLKVAKIVEAMEVAEDCEIFYSVENATENLAKLSAGVNTLTAITEALEKVITSCNDYLARKAK